MKKLFALLIVLFVLSSGAMAQNFNFPDSPTLDQVVTGPGGQQFRWDGTRWISLGGVPNSYAPLTNPAGGQNNYAPLVNPALANPSFNQKINNGSAFQTVSVSGCTTAANVGATCSVTLTWPQPFSDSFYAVFCQGGGTFTGVPIVVSVSAQAATGALVWTQAATAVAASFQGINCLGIHF